jgi:hypothetical protein
MFLTELFEIVEHWREIWQHWSRRGNYSLVKSPPGEYTHCIKSFRQGFYSRPILYINFRTGSADIPIVGAEEGNVEILFETFSPPLSSEEKGISNDFAQVWALHCKSDN